MGIFQDYQDFQATYKPEPEAPPAPAPSGIIRRTLGDTAVGLARGAANLPNIPVGIADIFTGGKVGKAIEDTTGYDFNAANKYYDTLLSPEARAAKEKTSQTFRDEGFVAGMGEAITSPSVVQGLIAENIIPIGATAKLTKMGLGALSKAAPVLAQRIGNVAVGAGEGAQAAGMMAEDVRTQNADRELTAEQAALIGLAGVGTAGVASGVSKFAGSVLGRKLGVVDPESMLAGVGDTATTAKLPQRIASSAVMGSGEEMIQSGQETALQNTAMGKPWQEGMAESIGLGGLTGGVMSGGFGALASAPAKTAIEADLAARTPEEPTLPAGPLSKAIEAVSPVDTRPDAAMEAALSPEVADDTTPVDLTQTVAPEMEVNSAPGAGLQPEVPMIDGFPATDYDEKGVPLPFLDAEAAMQASDPVLDYIATLPQAKAFRAMKRLSEPGGRAIVEKQMVDANPAPGAVLENQTAAPKEATNVQNAQTDISQLPEEGQDLSLLRELPVVSEEQAVSTLKRAGVGVEQAGAGGVLTPAQTNYAQFAPQQKELPQGYEEIMGEDGRGGFKPIPKRVAPASAPGSDPVSTLEGVAAPQVSFKLSPEFAQTITDARNGRAKENNIKLAISELEKEISHYDKLRGLDGVDEITLDKVLVDRRAQLNELLNAEPVAGASTGDRIAESAPTPVNYRTADETGRANDGKGGIKSGEVFKTSSGRMTTPFPKQNGQKYLTQWVIDNAVAEAESRGDKWNAGIFKNTTMLKGGNLTTSDSDSMHQYLYGEQPAVPKPFLKPLSPSPAAAVKTTPAEVVHRNSNGQPVTIKTEDLQSIYTSMTAPENNVSRKVKGVAGPATDSMFTKVFSQQFPSLFTGTNNPQAKYDKSVVKSTIKVLSEGGTVDSFDLSTAVGRERREVASHIIDDIENLQEAMALADSIVAESNQHTDSLSFWDMIDEVERSSNENDSTDQTDVDDTTETDTEGNDSQDQGNEAFQLESVTNSTKIVSPKEKQDTLFATPATFGKNPQKKGTGGNLDAMIPDTEFDGDLPFSRAAAPVANAHTTSTLTAAFNKIVNWTGLERTGNFHVVESGDMLPDVIKGAFNRLSAAWHGGPHDFNTFDMDKVGTGEGAQAYGYGLYFAGDKEVAQHYRDNLSAQRTTLFIDGTEISGSQQEYYDADDVNRLIMDAYNSMGKGYKSQKSLVTELESRSRGAFKEWKDRFKQAIEKAKGDSVKVVAEKGKLYKVELAPEDNEYLLWDKPLSEQSEKVKAALGYESLKSSGKYRGEDVWHYGEWFASNEPGGWIASNTSSGDRVAIDTPSDIIKLPNPDVNPTGETIYKRLIEGRNRKTKQAASEYLHSLGIRGIKYADGNTRNKAEQNFNYVIFNDQDVSITEKYSLVADKSGIKGVVTPDGQVYFVADQIAKGEEKGLLLHELGVHFGLESMVGADKFAAILKQMESLRDTSESVKRAYASVPKDTAAKLVNEEALGYLAEQNPQHGIIRRIIAAIKSFLFQKGILQAKHMKEADLMAVVKASLEQVSKEAAKGKPPISITPPSDIRYSRAIPTSRAELKETLSGILSDNKPNRRSEQFLNLPNDIQQALRNVGGIVENIPIKERFDNFKKDFWSKFEQNVVDQFAPLKRLGDQAYLLARLSKGFEGTVEALITFGNLNLVEGVYDSNAKGVGLVDTLKKLQGEQDRFFWWVSANRAGILKSEEHKALKDLLIADGKPELASLVDTVAGRTRLTALFESQVDKNGNIIPKAKQRLNMLAGRENLFSDDDIVKLKKLTLGNMADGKSRRAVYQQVLNEYMKVNKNVLDIAEESGVIGKEAREIWESEFYIPFFRDKEDSQSGVNLSKSGLVRQKAFERLKGGKDKLNQDLLHNIVSNWAHLIEASSKNRAATESLKTALSLGIAKEVSSDAKGSVWITGRRDRVIPKGQAYTDGGVDKVSDGTDVINEFGKIYYQVDDPYIMAAITAMDTNQIGGVAVEVMAKFKRLLTFGVTISPTMRIRNILRDSISAMAVSKLGFNPAANIKSGITAMKDKKSQDFASLLAGGGIMRFGAMLDGANSDYMQRLINSGVKKETILGTTWDSVKSVFDKYQDLGDIAENANRAALYKQLRAGGASHATATLAARDLLDFSKGGSHQAVRFLTTVVPFLNARIQGLAKLQQGFTEDPRKFYTVLGGVALASVALAAAYGDDEDWQKREDWDKANYWWFKVGGTAFRIPKPFEIGAIATVAELGFEKVFHSDQMSWERFGKMTGKMITDNLSMNPVPQMFKPTLDIYANKNSFTGRPIESMGMEQVQKSQRFNGQTSEIAKFLGLAGNYTGVSPVQVDALLKGYLGWLGTAIITATDYGIRPMMGRAERPAMQLKEVFLAGNFVETLPSGSSRYTTMFYDQAKEIEQTYATYRQKIKEGDVSGAREFAQESRKELSQKKRIGHIKEGISKATADIRRIEQGTFPANTKRKLIDDLKAKIERLSKLS